MSKDLIAKINVVCRECLYLEYVGVKGVRDTRFV